MLYRMQISLRIYTGTGTGDRRPYVPSKNFNKTRISNVGTVSIEYDSVVPIATRNRIMHSSKKTKMTQAEVDNNGMAAFCAISSSLIAHISAPLYSTNNFREKCDTYACGLRGCAGEFNVILCRRLATGKSDSPSYFIMFERVVRVECTNDKWMRDSCTFPFNVWVY